MGAFGLRCGGLAAPQGHIEEEEEEWTWGLIAVGFEVLWDELERKARPSSVDAAPRRGCCCGASLHPSPANKASAVLVPPLPLTHGLTQPNPLTALHLHLLTYKAGRIPAAALHKSAQHQSEPHGTLQPAAAARGAAMGA